VTTRDFRIKVLGVFEHRSDQQRADLFGDDLRVPAPRRAADARRES
jgi:hypothetical protein